jgi:hypothetical protein
MKKKFLYWAIACASFSAAKSQCGITNSTYSSSTSNYIPRFNNATGCISVSQIQDNLTNVGLGVAPHATLKLDVNGAINTAGGTVGYHIGTAKILWRNASGIYVGEGAGSLAGAVSENAYVGFNAGYGGAANTARGCTFVGWNSGASILTQGDFNTFIGHSSGINTGAGAQNVFAGYLAGNGNTSGSSNCAFGPSALSTSTTYSNNCAFGSSALYSATNSNNSAFGHQAGNSIITGFDNTIIGSNSDVGSSSTAISNATALGNGATVNATNTMILGNNDVTGVGIGYSNATLITNAKFNVTTASTYTTGESYSGHFLNTSIMSGSTPYNHGIWAEANGNETNNGTYHYGGSFRANNAYRVVAVSGVAVSKAAGFGSSSIAYGGYFNSSATAGGTNATVYGVYATATGGLLSVAVYGSATNAAGQYAGYFSGDVYTTGGTNSGTGYLVASDAQFKNNVQAITNPINIIKNLEPKAYFYDTTANNGMHFSSKKQYGFIAQNLQTVLPELVYEVTKPADVDTAGNVTFPALTHKAVNYDAFAALSIAAIKQQQTMIDSLKKQTTKQDSINNALQNQINQILNTCCGAGNRTNQNNTGGTDKGTGAIDIQLSNSNSVVLNQNVPNPYAESTVITFNIPENAGFAQIIFNDTKGQILKIVDIKTKGRGQINVFASDLSSGIYSYSLYIDGKITDTKKMVKTD